jgi:hypothetical protein
MNLDISTLFPDLEALTPDGRWAMLQKWLRENPEYGERFERWSTLPVDQVYVEIEQMAVKKYGPLATLFFNSPAVQIKFKSSIETLQACYRERAGVQHTSGWMEPDNDPRPSAHKSINDYQRQLKAKKRRRKS